MGMSLASLTAAIQTHIDSDMEKVTAEGMAEHALGFFGFYDRIIDNALEPTDRNLFYMFQDYEFVDDRIRRNNSLGWSRMANPLLEVQARSFERSNQAKEGTLQR